MLRKVSVLTTDILNGLSLELCARACVRACLLLTQVMETVGGLWLTRFTYFVAVIWQALMSDFAGDWQQIMRSSVSRGPCFLHRCQVYLEVAKQHGVYYVQPFICVKEYLSDFCWQVNHTLPITCNFQSYFEAWERKKKPLKRQVNELKSVCSSVCLEQARPRRGDHKWGQGQLTQPERCVFPGMSRVTEG